MFSILGAVLFGVIATMTVLVACGLPLGEFTKSKKEKYVMTPISLIVGICFWITAFQM